MSESLQSVEVEQGVLGAVFFRPENIDELAGGLEPEHFYEPLHGDIFALMRKLREEGRAVTPLTLAPYFEGAEPVGQLSVKQYLGRLLSAATTAHAKEYAKTVREFAERRKLADLGNRLRTLAADHLASVSQIASETIGELDSVISSARPNHTATQASIGDSVCTLIEDLENGHADKPITTGLKDLDRVIGGWRRGEYAIVAARPSMGKSAFAAETMLSAARAGHGVMIFSLEMTKKALAARCLSSTVYSRDAEIPYSDILNERVTESQRRRLFDAASLFHGLPIEIEDQGGLTVSEIASKSRRQASRFEQDGKKLDLLIIDHLGKVRASKRYAGNLVAETGEVSNALASLGKELNVAMLVLHQLNRAVEGRTDKHPELSDLRNSGDIEQDADTIGFLYRPAYYLERSKIDDKVEDAARLDTLEIRRNELEIIIAKNRSGPCTTCECFVDIASNKIGNLNKEGGR